MRLLIIIDGIYITRSMYVYMYILTLKLTSEELVSRVIEKNAINLSWE